MSKRASSLPLAFSIAATMGFAGVYGFSDGSLFPETLVAQAGNCNIKGNISSSGERIYHVPGQRYYADTRIEPHKGERWFCSEAEARAAGWRRAKV